MNTSTNQRRLCASVGPLIAVLAVLLLPGCQKKVVSPPAVKIVRSVVVEEREVADPIIVTGHLRARDEVNLAFRLSGKLIQRAPDVGDTVTTGQIVAVLAPEVERNTRNAAQADLTAAKATLEQAHAFEARERELLTRRVIAQDEYDVALRQLKTAKAQVEAAQAKLKLADEQLSFTELKAEAAGVVTQKGAEPGEVVQAGQMILTVAQQGGRDAIFDVPAQVIRDGLASGLPVEVWLADKQEIKTTGTVREISPQADPATRNYRVKVEVTEVPQGMFLGATTVGRFQLHAGRHVEIPSTALTMRENKPAVWVIAADTNQVRMREVSIARYTPNSVIIAHGLKSAERVVTAGVQELHEGQLVRTMGDPS